MISRFAQNHTILSPIQTIRQPSVYLSSLSTIISALTSASASFSQESKLPVVLPSNVTNARTCNHQRCSLCRIQSKSSLQSPLFGMSIINCANHNRRVYRQQVRFWNESTRNPAFVAKEEEARQKAEAELMDEVGLKQHQIASDPGDTQTIWALLFLDGKLVNGTQITIPKSEANIDMIKYAVKERCSEILKDIAALTFQILPTRHKRKKSKRKLTRKNRILKSDVLYDMAKHGGESEAAGIIVKAHTRKMKDGNHFTYGEQTALELGIDFVKAIMQEYQEIANDDGTKVLPSVPDLECGTIKNVVLRNNITESFWNRVYEIAEGSTKSNTASEESDEQEQQEISDSSIQSIDNDDGIDEQQDHNDEQELDIDSYNRCHEGNHDDQRYRVCVVGSSGVGKTTTTAVLIRLLLQRGKSVVYHIRTADKSRWVYEFIPNKNVDHNVYNIEVKVVPEQNFNVALTPTIVDDINNFYIVDPSTTFDKNCNPDDQVQCRVVLITSPDERQWGGSGFTAFRGGKTSGTFLYYPTWTLAELQSLYMSTAQSSNATITYDTIAKRYHDVGGIPGHTLAPSYSYRDIITTQSDIIATLTDQQLKLISQNYWKEMGRHNTIVGYARSTASDSFDNSKSCPISTKVFESICLVHKRWFWNQLRQNTMDSQFAYNMFAVLCRNSMQGESVYHTKYRDGVSDSNESTVSSIALGGCDKIESCDTDVMSAATETENVVFHKASSTTTTSLPAIDFVYRKGRDFHVFCSTVERQCQIDVNDIQKFIGSTGNFGGSSTKSTLHLYYIVPSFNFDTFAISTLPDQSIDEAFKYIDLKIRVLMFQE